MKAILSLAVVFLSPSGAAIAQSDGDWRSWPLADQLNLTVGAFFPNLDTVVRLDASDASLGTTVNFEQNLGLPDTKTLGHFSLGWRFAKNHQLVLRTFNLNRSGSAIAVTDIRFGDEVFSVDLPISSFFDTQVVGLEYSYSLVFDEKKELAVGAGLSVQDVAFGLAGNAGQGIIEANSGLTAPLPSFGLRGGYAFTDRLLGRLELGVFAFDLAISDEENLSGKVLNGYASLQHNTFEHVHFGLGYSYFDIQVDWTENALLSAVRYQYNGPMVTVTAAF